jgi:hypothetical protein
MSETHRLIYCIMSVTRRMAGRTLYFSLHVFFLDDVTPDCQFVLYFTNFLFLIRESGVQLILVYNKK